MKGSAIPNARNRLRMKDRKMLYMYTSIFYVKTLIYVT